MSALQLVRGYSSSLLLQPHKVIDEKLMEAHICTESTRAVEKLMRSKDKSRLNPGLMKQGIQVYVFYKS